MADWRLQNQEKYLLNAELYFRKYVPYKKDWEHDHCEFCQKKIAQQGGDFTHGYTTKDSYHWICPECFEDFKNKFNWRIIKNKDHDA